MNDYRIVVFPLPKEEGGGWFAEVIDLPGCGSDGATPEEALANVQDAKREWILAAQEAGKQVPPPKIHINPAKLEEAILEVARRLKWLERDVGEPDKILCHVQSLRGVLLRAGVRFDDSWEHPYLWRQ